MAQLPASVDGITQDLFEIIEHCAATPHLWESEEAAHRRAAFDLALISVMRNAMLRRSEAAELCWGHIRVHRQPGHVYASLTIPFSKTDKWGAGEACYLPIESLAALQDMARLSGRHPDRPTEPVFGISGRQISNRIQAACAHANLAGRYRGHSPRVGMCLDLFAHNTPLLGILLSGRWRVPSTVLRYLKTLTVADSPIAHVSAQREAGLDAGLLS